MNITRKFLEDRKGNFGLTFALLATPVIVGIGMAVDVSRAVSLKSELQASLDASLIGAVGTDSTFDVELAKKIFISNVQLNQLNNASGSLETENPTEANYPTYTEVSSGNWVAEYSAEMPLTFPNSIIGEKWDISVATGAKIGGGTTASVNLGCIYTLSDGSQSLTQNSGATITAPGCTINVGTNLQPNSGKTGFNNGINFDIDKVCVAGRLNYDNRSDRTTPKVETSCETPGDFYKPVAVDMMLQSNFTNVKNANCINNNWISYDENSLPVWTGTQENSQDIGYQYLEPGDRYAMLEPGKYCGGVNFNSGNYKIIMKPGLYYVQNDWNINGSDIIGDDVSVFFDTNGKWQPNSNTGLMISAPKSGAFQGFAIWENPNASSNKDFTINTTKSTSYINGILYLPQRKVTFNSGADAKYSASVMVKELTVNGNTKMTFDPVDPDHIPTNSTFSPPTSGVATASSKVTITQ